jgi:decaprenylphospho-beta-D-erythro-pentofuranosid-2-ulose 2-reductase
MLDRKFLFSSLLNSLTMCESSVEETLAEIQTNALSTISLLTLIANRFEARKSGTICVISSGLRQRLHKSNVAVVTIKPGFVDTPMTKDFKKGLLWTNPAVVAKAVVEAIQSKKAELLTTETKRLRRFSFKSIKAIHLSGWLRLLICLMNEFHLLILEWWYEHS